MNRILRLTVFAFLAQGCVLASGGHDVPVYGIFKQSFTQSGSYGNPYTEVTATATFIEPDGRRRSIPLFWDGGNTWKVRFSPDELGNWNWSVSSSDSGLNKQTGSFNSVPSSNRGGILPMTGYPYHFQYQNGATYWLFGDTQWESFADDPPQNLTHDSMLRYFDVRASRDSTMFIASSLGRSEHPMAGPTASSTRPFTIIRRKQSTRHTSKKVISASRTLISTESRWESFPPNNVALYDPRSGSYTNLADYTGPVR